jgi:quinol-cytochrome oxidoreductase complex cytochrome b subunit
MERQTFHSIKRKLLYRPGAETDERGRMATVLNNLVLHLHPLTVPATALRFNYTWGLGGMTTLLAMLLGLTGLLLMFRYDARVEYAYLSIQEMETRMVFGSLIRAVHHWSANLLVISAFLHLLRVYFTGGFKGGRTANWVIGVALLGLVLASNFTGYLLPWDQLAFWAITVSTSLLAYIPLVGEEISRFLLSGPEVAQGALSNFYALHVVTLPILMTALMGYHFWKIRKNGGLSQPTNQEGDKIKRLTTMPHLVSVEFAAATALLTVVLVLAMLKPAPLGAIANPLVSPNPAKAAWYFLGLQELLLHMHPLAAMSLVLSVAGWMVFVPWLDRRENDIGLYFRSSHGKRAAILATVLGVDLIPALVIVDEFWLDLGQLFPSLPAWIVSGLIPFGASLLGLGLVYALMRLLISHGGRRANHSEAMLGLFTFLMVSLVVLTVIGVYFRGENMALVLPFIW